MITTHYNFNATKFSKRIAIILLAVYMVVTLLTLKGQFVSNAIEVPTYEIYVVSEGDTLWQIAADCNSTDDIRNIVYEIKHINNMSTTRLAVGQKIMIPKQNNN